MRKKFLVIAIPLASLAIGLASIPALAANPVNQVCNTGPGSPTDQCWNNWNGVAKDKNPVNYYSSGAINNNWQVQLEGRVNGVNWPFSEGTGLNSRYNNDPVYLFKWNNQSQFCLDGGGYDQYDDLGYMYIWLCSGNQNQLFVYDSCGGLCSVYVDAGPSSLASIYKHETYPVWVACLGGACNDMHPVITTGNPVDTQDFSLKGAA